MDILSFKQQLIQIFEVNPKLWDRAIFHERMLLQTSENPTGIRIDTASNSIDFPISIREGGISAVFIFEGDALQEFINGKSLATLTEEGSIRCSGKKISIFRTSFFLDSIAAFFQSINSDDSHYIH
ncbi:MAG TPA: hypothetical protein PKA63_10960 [Oligoflexia bacterium]|nr:hypothetical protein [Oligoflexia bacterium]HMP49177.1 hypothetical protein [Oligoflexia bacterium]